MDDTNCTPWHFKEQKFLPKLDTHVFKLAIAITKTYLYNFGSLKPHFYVVKLGWDLQGYTLLFFFLSENFLYLVVTFSVYLNKRIFVMTLNKLVHIADLYTDNHPYSRPRMFRSQFFTKNRNMRVRRMSQTFRC